MSRPCPAPVAVGGGRSASVKRRWLGCGIVVGFLDIGIDVLGRTTPAAVVLAAGLSGQTTVGSRFSSGALLAMRGATIGSRPGAVAIDHRFETCL